jgi:DNA-dependent RNA polymerase auxiliary subunit epsilon
MSKTYQIHFWRSYWGLCYIEADSEEEAKQKFNDEDHAFENINEDCGDDVRIDSIILAETDQ